MAVTYTATDSTGMIHTRTSARHLQPIYTHAVVMVPGNAKKSLVTFSSRRDLAVANLQKALGARHWSSHELRYPDAELVELVATVKAKRA